MLAHNNAAIENKCGRPATHSMWWVGGCTQVMMVCIETTAHECVLPASPPLSWQQLYDVKINCCFKHSQLLTQLQPDELFQLLQKLKEFNQLVASLVYLVG